MNLIVDRTATDVLMGTEKGHYCVIDLNRVEQAVGELCRLAKALGVAYEPIVKTDWGYPGVFPAGGWPTESQMARYLGNVSGLCKVVEVAAKLPATMENLNWEGANDIEKALLSVYTRIKIVLQAFKFSGELYAGEESTV